MNNFFCGLHFLVGLAEAAEETLKIWEATVEDRDIDGKPSGTQRLIRTACKAFHHRGSEQAGCSTYFRSFLRRQGITSIPLASFKGNRFNILFYDGAGVYWLRKYMLSYLTQSHGTSLNRLLQAVCNDLQSSYCITGCRALGIIDKMITGPFWRFLQLSNISILEMSNVYTTLMQRFEEWSNDGLQFIKDKPCLYGEGWTIHSEEKVFSLLFEKADEDCALIELLQLLFKSFTVTIQRLVVDHLPGGEWHEVSNSRIIQETKSVPKTNVSPERDFAILDRLLSQKPNASYIALESLLLFSQNKSMDWLRSKSVAERERLLSAARTLTSVHRATFKKRRQEIERLRQMQVEKRERELQMKRDRDLKAKEELTLKIQQYGLWTTRDEVIGGLDQIKNKKGKLDALKVQIKFRKIVLNQTHSNKQLFQFSLNGRQFTIETDNLLKLHVLPSQELNEVALSTLTAEQVEIDPELLIYRRIKHLFEYDGSNVWFEGTVLSYEESTQQYTVAYDNEDTVFTFDLLEDLKLGELIVQ